MPELPEAAIDVLKSGHLVWVSTVGADGWPNVAIKGSAAYFDDGYLYFADMYSNKTRTNLLANSRAAVGIYDPESGLAIQVKGTARFISEGDLYRIVTAEFRRKRVKLPEVKHIVQISIDCVYDMGTGPNAGKLLTINGNCSGM